MPEGENLMEVVVANRITAIEKQIEFLSGNVDLIDEALEILHHTRFDSPLELTEESDFAPELTDEQRRVFSWLDRSNLVRFKSSPPPICPASNSLPPQTRA